MWGIKKFFKTQLQYKIKFKKYIMVRNDRKCINLKNSTARPYLEDDRKMP